MEGDLNPDVQGQNPEIPLQQELPDAQAVARTIKLPPFWEEDPQLWFLQAEAIFGTYRIQSQNRKAQIVIGQLPYKILTQIADLARNPGPNPYDELKRRLIETYSQSQERRIIRLLEETRLGDQKPSQLLRHMQTLSGNTCTPEVIRTVWLRALPSKVRSILASLAQDDLNQLAVTADKIIEVDASPQIYAVQESLERTLTQRIIEEVGELKKLILNERGRSRERDNSRSRKKSPHLRKRSSSRNKRPEGYLCMYHFKFGDKAYKCSQPCAWKKTDDKNEPVKAEN